MNPNQEYARELLDRDLPSLYADLGRELAGSSALPMPRAQLQEAARRWLDDRRQELAAAICGNETVALLATREPAKETLVNLVTAIADLIAARTLGVSPVVIAALLAKLGLKLLCGPQWPAPLEANSKAAPAEPKP